MSPQTWQTISEKTLSGKAVINLTAPENKILRYILLQTRVIRDPKSKYVSKKTVPDESFYGKIIFSREGYVMSTQDIKYEEQVFDIPGNLAAQLSRQLTCIHQETLQTFINLRVSLTDIRQNPPVVTENENETKDWKEFCFYPDKIQFVLVGGTAISAKISVVCADECNEINEPPPPPEPPPEPPQPPEPPTPRPPGQPPFLPDEPVPVDPPNPTDKPGEFDPFPGDYDPEPEPEPPDTGREYRGELRWLNTFGNPAGPSNILGYLPMTASSDPSGNILVTYGKKDSQGNLTYDTSVFGFGIPGSESLTNIVPL